MKDFAIYVHFPFCKSRCIYCDFVSNVVSPLPVWEVTGQFKAEIDARRQCLNLKHRPVSIYLGGGTPSLWPADALGEIVQTCLGGASPPNIEITVELNPGDVDADWIRKIMASGVNRFSLGVQAMNQRRLEWLGRRHTVADAQGAIELLKDAGTENISVDFIYATPKQTEDQIRFELDELCALEPDHVSAYELTVADGTPLSQMTLPKNDSETQAALWECVGDSLHDHGFEQYEVSNFARNNKRSQHNSHYWHGGAYLGIGSGAHGFVVQNGERFRYSNSADLDEWLLEKISPDSILAKMAIGNGSIDPLADTDFARELMMLGLRCSDGIDTNQLLPLILNNHAFKKQLNRLIEEGMVMDRGNRLIPTRDAMRLADELALRFF